MKSPALLLALILVFHGGGVLAADDSDASASWRFLDLHWGEKSAPLIPPPMSTAEIAACGDINAELWQCAQASPEMENYRAALQARRLFLAQKMNRMAQYPHTYDGMDLQLALTQAGLSKEQISPDLMRKLKTARFVISWRGHRHNRPQTLTFPY